MAGDNRSHQKTYVLTCDLANKIKVLRRVGLKVPEANHPFFEEFRLGLAKKIEESSTDCKVEIFDMEELADDIIATAHESTRSVEDGFIVSTCSEIASPSHGATLEVNRIVDPMTGEILGIGPRPGFPDVGQQIYSIIEMSGDKKIVLVEDGSFTGSTLCYIAGLFEKAGKPILTMIVGLAFPKACKRIAESFQGDFLPLKKLDDHAIDWMPDHDFCMFTPNNGRVVGIKIGEEPIPFFTHDGSHYSVPYLFKYAPSMEKWASIPGTVNALQFSLFCIGQTGKLFSILEGINQKEITLGLLEDVRPRIGIPYCVGSPLPDLGKHQRIVNYLSTAAHELD